MWPQEGGYAFACAGLVATPAPHRQHYRKGAGSSSSLARSIESGRYATVRELARAEKINESYLCRVLRLTLLSPTLTEAILNGLQPDGLDLARLVKSLPVEWDKQEAEFRQDT